MTQTPQGDPRPTTGGPQNPTLRHAMSIIRQEAWKQQALSLRHTAELESLIRNQYRTALTEKGGAQ